MTLTGLDNRNIREDIQHFKNILQLDIIAVCAG